MDNDAIPQTPSAVADIEPEVAAKRRHPARWIGAVVVIAVIAGATVALTNTKDTKSPTIVLSEAASRTTSSGTRAGRSEFGGHLQRQDSHDPPRRGRERLHDEDH